MMTQNSKRLAKSIPSVAVMLAIPGLVLSQIAPFSSYAAVFWLTSGAFMLVALTFAIRDRRNSEEK
jgi:hypothetical protein